VIKFGIQIAQEGLDYPSLKRIALGCEKLGFDSIWLYDHLYPLTPPLQRSVLESWVTLAGLAAETHTIRIGSLVTCNLFRHPSLLAKMSATLDVISEGRLEFGIGAGWYEDECIAYGIPFPKAGTRINQLREAVQIIKRMWTQNETSFEGEYYNVRNVFCNPKPLQKPHPPIWIGGNSPAIKSVVAEVGDGWIPVLPTAKQIANGLMEIKDEMKRFGRDPESLRVAYGGSGCAVIAKNEEMVKRLAEPLVRSMGKRLEELTCLIGIPEQCIQKIEQYQEAGTQKIVAGFYDFPSLHGMRLFAKEVIPHFSSLYAH